MPNGLILMNNNMAYLYIQCYRNEGAGRGVGRCWKRILRGRQGGCEGYEGKWWGYIGGRKRRG